MRDQYNEEIIKGDFITYPARKGSDMSMRTAKVLRIEQEYNYLGNLTEILKCAVYFGENDYKKVTLRNISNITIIPRMQIPLKVRSGLDCF